MYRSPVIASMLIVLSSPLSIAALLSGESESPAKTSWTEPSQDSRQNGKEPIPAKAPKGATQTNSGQTKAEGLKTPDPVGERPVEPSRAYKEIEAIFERQGVLTPRNSFVLELSTQYAYSSSTRVALLGYTIVPAITIGLIDVRGVNRQTAIGALTGRFGLTNRIELEAKVPYIYRNDSATTQPLATETPESVFNADGGRMGDVEFGLRYQLNIPRGNERIFIAGLRAKSKTGESPFSIPLNPATNLPVKLATGSGFWALQPNMTVIFPSEPAVFFGSLTYLYNIDRTVSPYGRIKPGDTISGNFGIGYAVNEKASFSLGYEHSVILKTHRNGYALPNSKSTILGSFLIGISYRVAQKTSLNISLAGGLTEDAPDVQLTLRLPMMFSLRAKR